jgi:hypothetical protein
MKLAVSVLALATSCLCAASAAAQQPSATFHELGRAVLEYFVGDWEVETEGQGAAPKGARHIEWLFEGQSVISRAKTGSTATCVIFACDPVSKTVNEWGFSNSGAHWKIAWTAKPEGQHFALVGDLSGFTPDGQTTATKGVTVTVESRDRFVVRLPAGKMGDQTTPARTLRVTRKH